MSWRRRGLARAALASLLATLALLGDPSPPPARANVACDAVGGAAKTVTGGIEALTGGAIGAGNPVGDACNAVSGKALGTIASPVSKALKGIGSGVFDQVTTWVSEGTVWLIEQVLGEIEKTTTPKLTSSGFLAEYGQMAEIAALLAAAMLLLAVIEAVAQGSWGLLARAVAVNVPLAFVATSVAFAVVQLLLVATDGMCHAVAAATHEHSRHFFKAAIAGLAKGGATAGSAGSPGDPATEAVGGLGGGTAVPLFVTFLAAIVGAFAAFFVWLELIARDAAVYVVALFMPMALAASIWPRWSGALRRTAELMVTVVGSKFVIVSIVALAAGLVAEGGEVEHLLAASALMLLACFAPFMLLRLVPFAEGAMAAAYGRRSATGAGLSGLQLASEVQIIRNMARSNWRGASPPEVWSVSGGGPGGAGGGGAGRPSGGPNGEPGGGGAARGTGKAGSAAGSGEAAGAGAAAGVGAGAAAAPASAAASVPAKVARGARSGAQRLEQSAVGKAASEGSDRSDTATQSGARGAGGGRAGATGEPAESPARQPSERPARPAQEPPAKPPSKGSK